MNRKSQVLLMISIVFCLFGCDRRSALYNDQFKDLDYCQIVPILEKACLRCHNSNGLAPFSFEDENLFQRKKSTILEVLDRGIMPPWKPNPEYSRFKHEYFLTQIETQKLYTWVANGSVSNRGCQPSMERILSIGNVERGETYRINNGYAIPENVDHYKCFIVANPYKRDVYLSAIDLIPGSYGAVHHMSAFLGTDPEVLKNCVGIINPNCDCDYTIDSTTTLLSNWTKGSVYSELNLNEGFLLPKESYLQIQIHYSPGFQGFVDSSKVSFTLSNSTNVKRLYCDFWNNFKIRIEPNQVMYDTLMVELENDIIMRSIWPHTHNITTWVRCFAVSGGDTIPLIEVPEWDYLWQSIYEFQESVHLNKGDKVFMVVLFDNTSKNTRNPSNPPATVTYGRRASDEMLTLAYYYNLR